MALYEPIHKKIEEDEGGSIAYGTYSSVSERGPFAVKRQMIEDADDFIHILNEISVHRACAAHGIAPALGRVYVSGRRVCTEMQRGVPLHRLMHKISKHRRASFIMDTFSECARLLEMMHRRLYISHSDVYLDNIIMVNGRVQLIDFGLSEKNRRAMPVSMDSDQQKDPVRCHLVSGGKRRGNPFAGDVFALCCLPVILLLRSHQPWGVSHRSTVTAECWCHAMQSVRTAVEGIPEEGRARVTELMETCEHVACDVLLPVQFAHNRSRLLIEDQIPVWMRSRKAVSDEKEYVTPVSASEWEAVREERSEGFRQTLGMMEGVWNRLNKRPRLVNVPSLHVGCSRDLPWRYLVWVDRVLYPKILSTYPFPKMAENLCEAVCMVTALQHWRMRKEHLSALRIMVDKGDGPALCADIACALLANQDRGE